MARLRNWLAVAAVLALVAWLAALGFANSGVPAGWLGAELGKATGLAVELRGLSVGPLFGVTIQELRVADPGGGPFVSLTPVELGWRFPTGGRAPLVLTARGGRIEARAERWYGFSGPLGRVPIPGPQGPGLWTVGQLEMPPDPLVELVWDGLGGVVASARDGFELGFSKAAGRAVLHRGGGAELTDAGLELGTGLALRARGSTEPGHDVVHLALEVGKLQDLLGIWPLSAYALRFGLLAGGAAKAELDLEMRRNMPLRVQGSLAMDGAELGIGSEPLAGPFTGTWKFEGGTDGVAGELDLAGAGFPVQGLPLAAREVTGSLEIRPGRVRLGRGKARCPWGPLRLGYGLSFGESFGWELAAEAGGDPGHWLTAGTLVAGPAGLAVRSVRVQGPRAELELSAQVSPLSADPPRWSVGEARAVGKLGGAPLDLAGLAGELYLDREGGYSFQLEGQGAGLTGQLAPGGGLKLWLRPAGKAVEALVFDPPAPRDASR